MNKILSNKQGNVILELRQETASAWLTIKQSGHLVDEMDILALIEEAGIKSGFDEALEYIRDHNLEKEFNRPFPIALCSVKGAGGECRLNYHFDTTLLNASTPQLAYAELSLMSYVHAGDTIASYSDNIFERGGSIYDIFGELITPPQVDEASALALIGENVAYESREYIAQKTGYPYQDSQGKLCILDTLRIEASTIPQGESIRSPLALIISGNLNSCSLASASQITVYGNLEGCSVYTETDLVVEGDILHCQNPGIQVLGNMQVHAIQESRVLVRKDLSFSSEIIGSTIAVDGSVLGDMENSRICGGLCQAANDIQVAITGDEKQTETEIEIAISPFYRTLLMQMTKEMVRYREESDEGAINDLQERIKRCEAELDNQLNTFLKRPGDVKKSVSVLREVYPKCYFRILKHSYQIKTHQKNLYLVEKE